MWSGVELCGFSVILTSSALAPKVILREGGQCVCMCVCVCVEIGEFAIVKILHLCTYLGRFVGLCAKVLIARKDLHAHTMKSNAIGGLKHLPMGGVAKITKTRKHSTRWSFLPQLGFTCLISSM